MRLRFSPRRVLAPVLLSLVLTLGAAAPAMAYAPVDIVHTDTVQVGPYVVTVGFSKWPLRALQSLDFTFSPDGGIANKSGTVQINGPGSLIGIQQAGTLVRHPREHSVWGLDTESLSTPGTYSFTFQIDGPKGTGQGTLTGVTVLNQPGPPLPLSWTIGSIPWAILAAFLGVAWRRTRPGRRKLII
jgi:hypothetical protein